MVSLAAALLLLVQSSQPVLVTGSVHDASGAAIEGAAVSASAHGMQVHTGADGGFQLQLPFPGVTLEISAPGFLPREVTATGVQPVRVVLAVRGITERVTVASSGARARLTTPGSVTVVDAAAVAAAPSLALDDLLRTVPGFSLFRRSSSRVANPTTQGVTLRGMAASGASRTAVLMDDVPLTDAFGGWIQWSRVPSAAVARVEVARGGASDLYGGDGIAGAIAVTTARTGGRLFLDGGTHGTARLSAFAGHRVGRSTVRGSAERFTTDGHVVIAPEVAGPIDRPANARHSVFYGGWDSAGTRLLLDARGGYLSESRNNGTPFQTNATRTRHAAARVGSTLGEGFLTARVNGAWTDYAQTFSAILPGRVAERPTSEQHVDSSSAGLTVDWVRPWRSGSWLLGASARSLGAELRDQPLSTPVTVPPVLTHATQRTVAVTGQWTLPAGARLTVAAGARGEHWSSGARGGPRQTTTTVAPRASILFQRTPALSVRGAVQGGYRLPTINELYRDFRVGSTLTQANPRLGPERSTGLEVSTLFSRTDYTGRVTAFTTWLSDAIVNVTLESSPTAILRQRRNAGAILARGVEVEGDARIGRVVTVTASAALIDSAFRQGLGLEGLRVPQVPRLQAAAGVNAVWASATAAVEWRFSGAQFDDDRNQFLLDRAGLVHVRAGWRPRRQVELFAAIENAFDVEQDVGRTPLRTIGMPRTARVGLRLIH